MVKSRVDQLLVERGLVESRTRPQALVMAGLVFSGDRKLFLLYTLDPSDE